MHIERRIFDAELDGLSVLKIISNKEIGNATVHTITVAVTSQILSDCSYKAVKGYASYHFHGYTYEMANESYKQWLSTVVDSVKTNKKESVSIVLKELRQYI